MNFFQKFLFYQNDLTQAIYRQAQELHLGSAYMKWGDITNNRHHQEAPCSAFFSASINGDNFQGAEG